MRKRRKHKEVRPSKVYRKIGRYITLASTDKPETNTPQAMSEFRVYSPIFGNSNGKIPLVSQDLPRNLFTPRTSERPVLLTNQTPKIFGGDNSKVSEKIPEPAVSQ
jgi:hypothetical protein